MADATRMLAGSVDVSSDSDEPATDARRLRRLVDAHFDFVWRVLRRMGVSTGDVDDAVQQCFLVASKHLARIGETQERAFLFQTAVRVALAGRRRERRRLEDGAGALPSIEDSSPGPDALLEQERARRLLDEVLDAMPVELRAAFVLFELEGFKLHEVAAALQVPQGTAASRVRRARQHYDDHVQRLRARMGRGGAR